MNKRWLRQVGSIVAAIFLMVSNILVDITNVYADILIDDSLKGQIQSADNDDELSDNILLEGIRDYSISNTISELLDDNNKKNTNEVSTVSEDGCTADFDDEDYKVSPDGAVGENYYPYKDYQPVDEYTYPGLYFNTDTWEDDWGFIKRQCTSFVAWKLNATNGVNFKYNYGGASWKDASTWGSAAQQLGILNDTPAVGAIAWEGSGVYGHVAWVAEVNGNYVTLEEYNNYIECGKYLNYSCRYNVPKGNYKYIHIKDIHALGSPIGHIDSASAGNGKLYVGGWAYDPDKASTPIQVNVYVDGYNGPVASFKTHIYRQVAGGTYSGFAETIDISKYNLTGKKKIYLWGIDITGNENAEIGNAEISFGRSPVGHIDSAKGGVGNISVGGWAYDPDAVSTKIQVNVYTDGYTNPIASFKTHIYREIAGGTYCGFDETIDVSALNITGKRKITLYGIDATGNANEKIGEAEVNITKKISVTGVSLNKSSTNIVAGKTETLTAAVSPANATNKSVTWTSSNTNIATVSSTGVVTAKSAGTATITVKTADGGKTATCKVTVNPATISVTGVSLNKSSTSIVAGKTETLTATVSPTNATNKSVTWTSSNTSIATVSSTGVVTAKSAGTATIKVKTADGGKTATCKVTVNPATVAVTGVSINSSNGWSVYGTKDLTIGKTEVLTAVITPSNATNKSVTWSSSNTNVATISNTGLVTAKAEGTATITVRTEDGSKSATCTITVGTIPVITTNSLPGGKAGQEYVYIFEAAGTKPIEWCMLDFWCDDNNSANDIFSGLGDENGRLSLYVKHGGNIRITVEASNRYGATSKEFSIAFIEDKPDIVESTTIVAGQKINLKEICFRNVDESISRYIVDNKKVASISKSMLSGTKAGTVKVTAQLLVGKNKYEDVATCNVIVLNKPKLKFGIPMTYEGQTIYASDYFTTSDTNTLGATFWESSKPDVVEVTDSTDGLLTAHKSGSAKITAYFGEKGKTGTLKVSATINVKKPAFQKSDYKLLTGGKAVLAMKNVVKAQNPEWVTENENVAVAEKQLDKNGQPTGKVIVKALNCGDTVLTARIDGQEYKCTIHVGAPKISKTKLTIKVNKNATVSLKNTKLPKSSIEWYSENPGIAAVSPNGKVKGIEKGQTIIYTEAGGVRNECVVTVK